MVNTLESIARGEVDAAVARSQIDHHVEVNRDFTKPYSVLLRWTWLALSERRADDDLRHWHRLIRDLAAQAAKGEPLAAENAPAAAPGADLAERLHALSDLIRVSIGMQTRPDKARLLTRAHVPTILQALYERQNEAVARDDLLQAVALKTANLSRILTLLTLEGLVERQSDGRTARFRITGEGIRHLRDYQTRQPAPVAKRAPTPLVSAPSMQPVKTAGLPEPAPELLEALRVFFEGRPQHAKRREWQSVNWKRAGAAAKTAASTEVKGGDLSSPMIMPTLKISGFGETRDEAMNIRPDIWTGKAGGPIKRRSPHAQEGQTVFVTGAHPAKPAGPEYTLFEAVLPARGLAKSVNG